MKVLSLPEAKNIEIRDIAKPELIPGHAIIRIEKCGICGSDVTAYKGVNPTMKYPIKSLGHEGVGVVDEISENDQGILVGDRVALEPYIPCNRCYMCKQKRYNNCTDIRVCGVHKAGMMSEYFLQPVQQLYKIPDEMSFNHAVLVEPFTIGLHAVERAGILKGENVVIFGAGIIGLMAAFASLNYGATPILVDVVQERLNDANGMGILHAINSKEINIIDYLNEVTHQKLPEAMIDCTGASVILEQMHKYVCYGGRIALVGWPHHPVTINTVRLMQKEVNICPSRNSNQKFPEAIKLIQERKIPIDALITKNIRMNEVKSTIEDMIKNPARYLKVIVDI